MTSTRITEAVIIVTLCAFESRRVWVGLTCTLSLARA